MQTIARRRLSSRIQGLPWRQGQSYVIHNPTFKEVQDALLWASYGHKDSPEIRDIVTVYGFCCNSDVRFQSVFTYFKDRFRWIADPKVSLNGMKHPIEKLRSIQEMKRLGGGDCDDFVVNLGAALLAANDVRAEKGQPPYEINHVYAARSGEDEPTHVFLSARHPRWMSDAGLHRTRGWVALDVPYTSRPGELAVGPPEWRLSVVPLTRN